MPHCAKFSNDAAQVPARKRRPITTDACRTPGAIAIGSLNETVQENPSSSADIGNAPVPRFCSLATVDVNIVASRVLCRKSWTPSTALHDTLFNHHFSTIVSGSGMNRRASAMKKLSGPLHGMIAFFRLFSTNTVFSFSPACPAKGLVTGGCT